MRNNQIFCICIAIMISCLLLTFMHQSGLAADGIPPGDENWDDAIGAQGANGFVGGVTFSHTQIIAGGSFNRVGSTTASIGGWDFSNWNALNVNGNNTVYSLAYDSIRNILYAGGSFTGLDGCSSGCNSIAKWDGSNWTGLDKGLNGAVLAMILDQDGNLYAGGSFTQAGSTDATYIAKWDGRGWSAMGDGIAGDVFALAFDSKGILYAGDNTGGLYYWDSTNSNWSSFITAGGGIFALAFDSLDHLYIGGSFNDYGNHIVMWDGTTMQNLEEGILDAVSALSVDSCDGVYVGTSGSRDSSPIMYWDGTDWSGLGNGIEVFSGEYVQTLSYQHGLLAVGGLFNQSGGKTAKNIALWTGADCAKVNGPGNYTLYADNLPITITLTEWDENISKLRIQRYNTNHPYATEPLQTGFYWRIEALDYQGMPASGYSLNLTMTAPFEPDNNDKLCHFDENKFSWNCSMSSFDELHHTLTVNGVTSLSDWAIGNNAGPTMVQILDIQASSRSSVFHSVLLALLLGLALVWIVGIKR